MAVGGEERREVDTIYDPRKAWKDNTTLAIDNKIHLFVASDNMVSLFFTVSLMLFS
jgi:hypothetical protein